MDRIVVVGCSGSGKTTLARRIAAALDMAHLELDSVFHRNGWTETPDDEFQKTVSDHISADRWIVDGNYTSHGMTDVLWPRADTFLWLDLPKSVTMRRVVARTLRRVITREELWSGVSEPWTNLYSLDPNKNIIVWAWTRYEPTRKKHEAYLGSGAWDHAEVHRMTATHEVDDFLASIE